MKLTVNTTQNKRGIILHTNTHVNGCTLLRYVAMNHHPRLFPYHLVL